MTQPFRVATGGAIDRLEQSVSIALFRIIQEAINNAIRHAQASSIVVHLKATEGAVTIDVIDDGLGLGNAHRSSGGGIENMKTRARLISARFAIKAAAVSGGTLVSVSLPAKELSAKGAAA